MDSDDFISDVIYFFLHVSGVKQSRGRLYDNCLILGESPKKRSKYCEMPRKYDLQVNVGTIATVCSTEEEKMIAFTDIIGYFNRRRITYFQHREVYRTRVIGFELK